MDAHTIQQIAAEVGLDDCGLVAAHRREADATFMNDWVAKGLHGNMSYLERNQELRYDPRQLVTGAQTIVIGVLTYAHSGHDYHRTMKSALYELEKRLVEEDLRCGGNGKLTNENQQHVFCDSAPFLERAWAVEAGLGFIGKNHQLIHTRLGSMIHVGELVLNVPVQIDSPHPLSSRCGSCTRCIEACPGQALGNHEWDARKCVAYITHHCLNCQLICPYNESIQRNENRPCI